MNNSAQLFCFGRLHDFQRILSCLPAVNNHWQLYLSGKIQLALKPLLLNLVGRLFIVVVKANFSHCHHFRLLYNFSQSLEFLLIQFICPAGMNTSCTIDKRIISGQLQGCLRAVHAGSYIDNGFHSCSCKTFNYRLSVFIECLVIVVCMCFKYQFFFLFSFHFSSVSVNDAVPFSEKHIL